MSEALIEGIFYFWGFVDNPAKKKAKETIKDAPADKIRKDLKRINGDFYSSLDEIKKQVSFLEQ